MIAICGEMPVDQLTRLPGGYEYKISIIKQLKKKHMIKTFYKDGLRGLRLLLPAKDELLKQNDERFSFYLTGVSETNHIRSEVPRRLRLHRMAETLITMQKGKDEIYRVVTIPLLLLTVLYGGGVIAQFISGYMNWQNGGGTPGDGTSPPIPSMGLLECIRSAFTFPYGVAGILICLILFAVLIFLVMRMGYGDGGAYDKERNFNYSDKGT